MTLNNETGRIVFWGPKGSGKTWLFRAFLREIELLNGNLRLLGYSTVVEEKRGETWKNVGHIEGLEAIPTADLTVTLYRFQKNTGLNNHPQKRFLANCVNQHCHEIAVIDNSGGFFEENQKSTLDTKSIEQAEDEVRNAHYLILSLNSGNTQTGQGTLVTDLRKLRKLLENSSEKLIAACITKVDSLGQELVIPLYNQNENELKSLLTRSFGRQYANEIDVELKALRNYHEVQLFATSATGYFIDSDNRKKVNLASAGTALADTAQWNPEEVARPFFWLFEKIERERLQYISKEDKLFIHLMQVDTILAARQEAYISYEQLLRLAHAKMLR